VTARPAFELADVFRRHGDTYERANAGHLGRVERRVIGAITACRTAALGGHVERCDDCGLTRIAYNSCRNRTCPKCQRQSSFVVYAKPPFGGPESVLAYLARYTYHTAIANSRLVGSLSGSRA
jgi:Transposase zinc-binding domain/Putative transposase